jgi:hypothetical protein
MLKKASELKVGDKIVDLAGNALTIKDIGKFPMTMEFQGRNARAIHLDFGGGVWSNVHPDIPVQMAPR